jgi:hypothetical protein
MPKGQKQQEMKKSEGSLKKQANKSSVVQGFADALFKSSWAEFEEEKGTSFSGKEILDVAPETPQEVVSFADRQIGNIESANGIDFDAFVPPGEEEGTYDPWELGWYIGMEYLGHGVSWSDDHEDLGLEIPFGEFSILEHDPENNKYEFQMEGSMTAQRKSITNEELSAGHPDGPFLKRVMEVKPEAKPEANPAVPDGERYRAVVQLEPSNGIVYGDWSNNPDEAQAYGETIGNDLVSVGLASSYTVDVETAAADAAVEPDVKDSEWGSFLDEIKEGSKKQAAGFPLFSKDAEEYIRLQTLDLADAAMRSKGENAPQNAQAAHAYIDSAIPQVVKKLTEDLTPEVKRVIEAQRADIFNDLTRGLVKEDPGERPAAPPPVMPVPAAPATPPSVAPQPPTAPAEASQKARMSVSLRNAFDNSYAYDAIETLLKADLGNEFPKKYKADELIDEEEFILDVIQTAFPDIARTNLTEAFGDVLTDSYHPSKS